jgi:hypothetical protein
MKYDKIEMQVIEDMMSWSSQEFYAVFGHRLETVVNETKASLQLKLKTIWRNRIWYAHRETGEQFDAETMLYFFDPKKISKYSLRELEMILEKIEDETLHSNPKHNKHIKQ